MFIWCRTRRKTKQTFIEIWPLSGLRLSYSVIMLCSRQAKILPPFMFETRDYLGVQTITHVGLFFWLNSVPVATSAVWLFGCLAVHVWNKATLSASGYIWYVSLLNIAGVSDHSNQDLPPAFLVAGSPSAEAGASRLPLRPPLRLLCHSRPLIFRPRLRIQQHGLGILREPQSQRRP